MSSYIMTCLHCLLPGRPPLALPWPSPQQKTCVFCTDCQVQVHRCLKGGSKEKKIWMFFVMPVSMKTQECILFRGSYGETLELANRAYSLPDPVKMGTFFHVPGCDSGSL